MLYSAHFMWGGAGAEYMQIAIDLGAVAIDDGGLAPFGFERARKFDGQIALAAGGWSCD